MRNKNRPTISITSYTTLEYGIHCNKLLLFVPYTTKEIFHLVIKRKILEKKREDTAIIKCHNAIENFGTQPECCPISLEN